MFKRKGLGQYSKLYIYLSCLSSIHFNVMSCKGKPVPLLVCGHFCANIPWMPDYSFVLKSTIHGRCATDLTVNSRNDIDTDVTVVRDLSTCSHFYPYNLPTSPLSLLLDVVRQNLQKNITTENTLLMSIIWLSNDSI